MMEVRTRRKSPEPAKPKIIDLDTTSILHLVESLNTSCCLTLQRRINLFLQYQIQCSSAFILYLLEETEEAIIQVIGDTVLGQELRFPIPSQAILSSISSRNQDSLDQDLETALKLILDPYPKSIIKVPIRHPERDGHISFIVCIADSPKTDRDEYYCSMIVRECFRFCATVLLNAFHAKEEKRMKEQCQKLLTIAKNFLLHLGDFNDLLKEIIIEARQLTNAERCSLFLLSDDKTELIAKVFDGVPQNQAQELRLPLNKGIAGHVATKGEMLNIRNAYKHPLFYKEVDESTGFKTRNILCFPIRDDMDHIVGVAQLCNKKNGFYFDSLDEQAAKAFSLYCGISIMHSILYKKLQLSQVRNRLSTELMMYHMMVGDDDVKKVLNCKEKHKYQEMLDYRWFSRHVSDNDSPCFTVKMFENLNLVKTWKMNKKTLIRFTLFVKKGYRNNAYHNWSHAFSVAHFAYYLMTHLKLVETCAITDLEGAAFLVSCLCHDLDHRGTTNSFQMMSKNTLASLYSSEGSVMERHHFSQALCILNTEGCNIFENLTCQQYSKVLDLMRDMILATDMAHHIKILPDQRAMSVSGYVSTKKSHRTLLLCLMMTCCDLNDQVKGWLYSKSIAEMIYTEFFTQGDMEKAMGNTPVVMMDREKAQVAVLQKEFLNDICIPCYSVLADIFSEVKECVESLTESSRCWEKAAEWFAKNQKTEGGYHLELLKDPSLEEYVLGSKSKS